MNPEFRSASFLRQHMADIVEFYRPNAMDPRGGYHHNYFDDGQIFEADKKHLVSSCRMIFNFCAAQEISGDSRFEIFWQHGLRFLREHHWQNERQGYVWTFADGKPEDETNHCYGLAFVMLAYAACLMRGEESARADIFHTYELLEKHFWQPEAQLYADEISPDWSRTTEYRGQNANMHCCEALLFAYEATQDDQFLDRAYQLAQTIAVQQADKGEGLIWEHFDSQLNVDWNYNKDDPKNLYRPWGFQPGHQTEWTKLLVMLHKHRPESWMIDRAKALFDQAVETAWDNQQGGLFYGFDPQKQICDDDKYFWVQAESFAAAALLAEATGEDQYWDWYNRLWEYSWNHFVDHEHGAWFRLLTADNQKTSNRKSEAGAKCDYHTLGSCLIALQVIER